MITETTNHESQKDPRTYAIIGACMEVHRVLGAGFLEAVYQEALCREFAARSVPVKREVPLGIDYKGQLLACTYKADFVCFDQVIVELKALDSLSGTEESQIINYLKATGLPIGLLVNFRAHPWNTSVLFFLVICANLRNLRILPLLDIFQVLRNLRKHEPGLLHSGRCSGTGHRHGHHAGEHCACAALSRGVITGGGVHILFAGCPVRGGAGGDRLRRRDHRAVRVRDHDAQPRPPGRQPGEPMAQGLRVDRPGHIRAPCCLGSLFTCLRADRSRRRPPLRSAPRKSAGRSLGLTCWAWSWHRCCCLRAWWARYTSAGARAPRAERAEAAPIEESP